MGFLDKFSVENIVILTALSLVLIWAGSSFLQWIGVLHSDVKLGVAITLFAVFLAVYVVFAIARKGFNLDKTDALMAIISVALIVALVFFVPKILPSMYAVGADELKVGIQSILNIG